ncbi:alpha/beta fold hydrolase [Niabella ginsengisoli]|uniref:Alpha/beta hydrolase n=1 Tax=Niabella ginsengisoli TaxID=522298 RepID=A0ABS9SEC5_9BACT|nr:alpha/beta hydrolase [Niabella ginsengisoli]MCH5596717.1 alpha/beta hydrolase [Niabella ginsengisoli]
MKPNESGYEEVNGIELYYEVYGSGEPLTLIHGGGSSIRLDFSEIVERLSNEYKLIGIDLQNHGKSQHRQVPETFEQDAKDVVGLLDAISVERSSFLGFSNGASTVLQIAHLFPEKVEKVIAASGVVKRSGMIDGFFEGMNHITIDHMPAYLKENFLQLNPDEGDKKLQNMFEKDSQRMIHFEDWNEEVLKSIKAPVFLISGDQDVVKAMHLAEMNKLIHNSRLMILPAGHGSFMMADENRVVDKQLIDFTAAQIRNFLKK